MTGDPAVGCDDWFGDGICRYCSLPVNRADAVVTHSYWQGMKFVSHKACKVNGEKAHASAKNAEAHNDKLNHGGDKK